MTYTQKAWSLALGLLVATASAWATPIAIPLNQDDFPPFGDPQVVGPLNQAIQDYNDANNTSYPTSIDDTPDIKVNTGDAAPAGYPSFGADTTQITLPVGEYNYLFLHWGGPQGGIAELWYLGECPDDATADFTPPVGSNSLSFYSFYDPNGTSVPDGGPMIGLIGMGLLTTALLARRARTLSV